jgi:cardiolipin synthase A/B
MGPKLKSFACFLIFYAWIVFLAVSPNLPDEDHPIRMYSNQTRQDIKLHFATALNRAERSIFLSVYGITDPHILAIIRKKANENLSISLEYDRSASGSLKKSLPPSVHISPVKSSGLMHRKIVIIDRKQVFLGSANLTTSSLRHHANLVIGIHNPPLAAFLEDPTATSYFFEIEGQKGEIFLLPDPQKRGLSRLIAQLDRAKKKIVIAMFTLTHPEIAEAILRAQKRGLDVSIAIDAFTARGASKKTITALEKEGVKIFLSQGRELLHHKWAVMDEEVLIMGSANWTKAAFSKNRDFLLFLSPLQAEQKRFLNQLWAIIEVEAKTTP